MFSHTDTGVDNDDRALTLSQTSPGVYVFVVQVF